MVEDQIREELDKLGVTSVAPGLAEVAVKLARALDQIADGDSPTAQAHVADKLHALMIRLRNLAPVQEQGDSVDEFTREREKRRADVQQQQQLG